MNLSTYYYLMDSGSMATFIFPPRPEPLPLLRGSCRERQPGHPDPDYHGKTIGRTLVDMIKKKYKDYLRIAVIAYDDELAFYENCGFTKSTDASPMFITSLWT